MRKNRCLLVAFVCLTACNSNSKEEECPINAEDPEQYVIVGFWDVDDCSGDPIAINSFPVDNTAECYCWPGNSGENSADSFSCDTDSQSFTFTQYGSLTCGEDDNTPTTKTVYTDRCEQDIPPTLYSKILDYGACATD